MTLQPARAADPIFIPAVAEDGSLYPLEKMEAHRRGVLHLAVSIFVFDGDALLIQQRAEGKYHCGLQWANSCCTHPHWGEDPARAAARRLHEELGVTLPLTAAGALDYRAAVSPDLIEHERVQVFRASAGAALDLAPDPEEVAACRWITRSALAREIEETPARFAPWLRIYLNRWDELGV